MERKTVTRADLAEAVFRTVGLSRAESSDIVEMLLDEICAAIADGQNVLLSNFGTFQVREKKGRIGRNPKTGETATISQRRVVSFKASGLLKGRVFKAHWSRKAKANSKNQIDETRRCGRIESGIIFGVFLGNLL